MTAHTKVLGYGRRAAVVCEECGVYDEHDRTEPAQKATREHNEREHAFPDPLPDPDTEETR